MNHRFPAALLFLSTLICAQQDPAGSATNGGRPSREAVVVSLKFQGGTMAQFVAAVRGDQPKANIVLATKAQDAMVPAMVLKDAGIEQALEGAAMAAEAAYEVRVKEFRGDGEPVYSIVAYVRPTAQNSTMVGRDPREVAQRVFSLNELTGKQPLDVEPFAVETVLGALRLATEGDKSPPSIRFHEDSGLLLVRGTNAQADIVEMTLGTMSRDLKQRHTRAAQIQAEQRREVRESTPKDGR